MAAAWDFLGIVLGWIVDLWVDIKTWFNEQKLKVIGWIIPGFLSASSWFNAQKLKVIGWIIPGFLSTASWFNAQKGNILTWVFGSAISVSKWFSGQGGKINEFVFGQGGNLDKYSGEEFVKTSIYAKEEDVIATGSLMRQEVIPTLDFSPVERELSTHTVTASLSVAVQVIVWIAENFAAVPDELMNMVDGISAAVFFEEEVPVTETEIEEKRRILIEMFNALRERRIKDYMESRRKLIYEK